MLLTMSKTKGWVGGLVQGWKGWVGGWVGGWAESEDKGAVKVLSSRG
jgi:hypothetical protein